MKREEIADKVKVNIKVSVVKFGNFVFRETRAKSEKPKKGAEAPTIYAFPRSTASMEEIYWV